MRRDLGGFVIETFSLSLDSIHVESEFILLVVIFLRSNDVVVQRSSNNYSTTILTDLVRTDDIIIYNGSV